MLRADFSFHISHFTLTSHFSFINEAAVAALKCKLINDKLLKSDNCKLLNASEGGV